MPRKIEKKERGVFEHRAGTKGREELPDQNEHHFERFWRTRRGWQGHQQPRAACRAKTESNGRIRFLSDEEETILREAIDKRCPDHMEEFAIALNTGMRESEQYTTEWPQIFFKRKRIKLEGMKNGSDREITMTKLACPLISTSSQARAIRQGAWRAPSG